MNCPPYTCLTIDKLKNYIQEAEDILSHSIESAEDSENAVTSAEHALQGSINLLEEIRTANEKLRACAEYWEKKADTLQGELEGCEDLLKDIQESRDNCTCS
jgi:flagellar motility protein MotE (MotC chaperone)